MVALANGRCRFHGGKTPKGADWHKPVFSDGKTPGGQDKLNRKLYDLERARQKRAQRLATMTPAERAAYRKWHEARQPSQAARISYRERKRQAQEAKAALAHAAGRDSADPELLRLDEKIRRLEEQAAALMAKRADTAATIEELGIFG
ncbi:hypothetical protein SAMN02983003_3869 [Devosia enhydra]|uniref:Uncharacterized protein n=2 Tax=Devosia enhydra TaxID=665118 RepID=A0A1K2I375_9HYPH|nr:hypothetical protein SAMN02983003_3869 [Devosia enhydra]